MRTLKRQLCLVSIGLCIMSSAAHGQQKPAFHSFAFKPDSGEAVSADSARIVVPEVRGKKDSHNISFAVVRFNAVGDAAQPAGRMNAPIIYISGGSGAGISAAAGPRFAYFQALRQIGDVYTFDLRGAGRSLPRLRCNAQLDVAYDKALTRDALVGATRNANRACAAELRSTGIDPDGYNSREIVADIEALRIAIGAKQIRIVATSTGTHLALEYVRRQGDRVAAAVLAGTEAPGQTMHLAGGMDGALEAANASLMPRIRALVDSLRLAPVTAKVGGKDVVIGAYDVQLFVASTLGDRAQLDNLPRLVGALEKHAYAPLAGMKLQALKTPFQSPLESLQDCQSGSSAARTSRASAEMKTALLGEATLDFPDACDGWGVAELDASYRAPVRSAAHILFINGDMDGRTPLQNTVEARVTLPASAQLIVRGATHGDDLFVSTPAILDRVLAFLRAPDRIVSEVAVKR